MAYQRRVPPIRLLIGEDKFNTLIELLALNCDSSIDEIKNNSIKLKDKLLRYSILRRDENNDSKVDIRFYPSEAEDLLFLLINSYKEIHTSENYVDKLNNQTK